MPAPCSRTEGIFAAHALELRAFGLAVLPSDGKVPLVKNFRRWRGPPSVKTVEQFARQFPAANVAFVPGPSKLLVADVDTADQAGEAEELLGPTPVHVATSRGVHLYYNDPPDRGWLPGNLKSQGSMSI